MKTTKTIFKTFAISLLLMLTFSACTEEELIDEALLDQDAGINNDNVNAAAPCDFDLNNVQPNATMSLRCILDLNGTTVSLPADVTLLYDGGDIVNGTLNFERNGAISGELLNPSLSLSGDVRQVNRTTFNFTPHRWGIVEGEVTQEVAKRNAEIVNEAMNFVQQLGVTTFKLNNIDAYFYDDRPWRGGIEIPSNMNFEMTDQTHLRVHITSSFRSLIFLGEKENIKVSGGYLHGNRNLVGFDPYVGGGNLIVLKTGINITLENIHLSNSAQDGINIESMKHVYEPGYVPTQNILITGCTFDSNRRNNLSITDGLDMLVENCTFLNAGIDMANSTGIAPRYSIDLEPHLPYQNLERVTIRNCQESGSVAGGIVFANGKDYLFEGNTFESRVANNVCENVQIINNTLKNIIVGLDDAVSTSANTVISGNTLIGPGNGTTVGIQLYNQDVTVFNNEILNFGVGMQLVSFKNAHIYNNIIESNGVQDDGIQALFYLDNVLIENNSIKVNDFPYFMAHINKQPEHEGYSFTINNNSFESEKFGMFNYSQGLNFIGNTVNSGITLTGCINVLLDGNIIKASKPYSIAIGDNITDNLTIVNNVIENDDPAGLGHGIVGTITSSNNKNIEISNNQFSTRGFNSGINLTGFNGINVLNNSGYTDPSIVRPLIKYNGNNSTFSNNINLGRDVPNEIIGTNNTVN